MRIKLFWDGVHTAVYGKYERTAINIFHIFFFELCRKELLKYRLTWHINYIDISTFIGSGCPRYLGLRGTRSQETGDNYITSSFTIFSHQISFRWLKQWEWDGWDMWHALGSGEMNTGCLVGKSEGMRYQCLTDFAVCEWEKFWRHSLMEWSAIELAWAASVV